MKLADVAKKAKVSVTTVSRVLNEEENVKSSTRSRVQRVIEELKYYPNLHARSLAGGQSRTLGMIVSNLDNPFFLDVYRRFETLAMQQGFETIVAASHYDPDRLRAILRSMIGRRLAGVAAIVSETSRELITDLSGFGIPVAGYDFSRPGKGITNVRFNYRDGMRQMVEYLYDLGHRRMAFIAYPVPLGPTEDRRQAFLDTMSGYAAEAKVISARADGYLGGREAAGELLESGFPVTAILCVNDITAIGVLKELSERNIQVPEQVSITGFDNVLLAEFTVPSLTTVNIPRERIAELCFESLTVAHPPSTKTGPDYLLEPELIIRNSSGPPALSQHLQQ